MTKNVQLCIIFQSSQNKSTFPFSLKTLLSFYNNQNFSNRSIDNDPLFGEEERRQRSQGMHPEPHQEPALGGLLPHSYKSTLPEQLNAMQLRMAPVALTSDTNFVISAPTGAGKTVVMQLAMLSKS